MSVIADFPESGNLSSRSGSLPYLGKNAAAGRASIGGFSVVAIWAVCVAWGGMTGISGLHAGEPNRPAAMTVVVEGVRSQAGAIHFALFRTASDFPKDSAIYRGHVIPARWVRKGRTRVTFSGLRPGRYAVAVYHDENHNNKFDVGFFGRPLEGYGFSRNAPALLGPPSFDAASVKLHGGARRIIIALNY